MFESKVFNELLNRYHEKKLAHAFLLETNDIDRCHKELIKFIKTISCSDNYEDECKKDNCNICYLIDTNSFPGLIDVYADGIQIKKGQIQDIMDRFSTIPVFSEFNIYIINECEKLNISSANSILKFLEEPDDNIIGFYITKNKMNVISTIRSRCQDYNVYYEEIQKDVVYKDKIIAYINNIYKNKDAILYNKCEGIKLLDDRKEWIEFFNVFLNMLYGEIVGNNENTDFSFIKDFDNVKLVKLFELVQTILKYLQSNGNIELILDKFVIEMRNIYE